MPGLAIVYDMVAGNSDLTQVSTSEIEALNARGVPEFEYDAFEHWVFDTGNSAGLIGRVNNRALTLDSVGGYGYTSYSVALQNYGNSLVSTFADQDAWTLAVTCIYPTAAAYIGGNWTGSSTQGGALFLNTGGGPEVRSIVSGPAVPAFDLDLPSTPAGGSWITAAMSLDYTTGRQRILHSRGYSTAKTNDTADKTPSPQPIVLGNRYYNESPWNTTRTEFHEAIIFPRALSANELASLRKRQIVRAARRGLSVS